MLARGGKRLTPRGRSAYSEPIMRFGLKSSEVRLEHSLVIIPNNLDLLLIDYWLERLSAMCHKFFVSACLIAVISSVGPIQAEESAEKLDNGFVSLFNGKSLAGWTGSLDGYAVEAGNLVCVAGGKGNLQTEKEFTDFVMRFEFKLTPGANNGLGIRCPKLAEGNLHLDGIELQILDDTAEKYNSLKPYQYHGSVYGIVPAQQGALKPIGEWNQQEVTVKGRRIKVVLNGKTIVDADLDEATRTGTLDGQPHPGLARNSGYIGFLGHGDRVDFRRIQIKELPPTQTGDAKAE